MSPYSISAACSIKSLWFGLSSSSSSGKNMRQIHVKGLSFPQQDSTSFTAHLAPGPGSCPEPGDSEAPARSNPSGWTYLVCNPHQPAAEGNDCNDVKALHKSLEKFSQLKTQRYSHFFCCFINQFLTLKCVFYISGKNQRAFRLK